MDPHIRLDAPHYAPSIHIRETIRGFQALGHQVQHFLYADNLPSAERQMRQPSVQPSVQPAKPNPLLLKAKPLLRDMYELYQNTHHDSAIIEPLFCNNHIDFVYERLFHSKSAVSLCAHRRNVPIIVESNSTVRERKKYWGSPLSSVVGRVEIEVLQRADAVTVVSTPLKRYYERQGVPSDKITVLPNGVDEQHFAPDNITRDLRTELGLGDKLVAGFVGNIQPYHGIELLLPLARTFRSFEEIHFLIVGGGPGLKELAVSLAAEELDDRFTLVGHVPHVQVPDHIAAMDICLLPHSDWLNSPMKLLEYGAMGKAVIAPDLEAIRDIFRHGETAYLVEPGSVPALAHAIQQLATNTQLRAQLAQAARQHILSTHTWKKNAERIVELYSRIVT
jgi:glycosyltransferase involved in cell wall biosynthesis